ncbi:Catechol 2,3-dioxygenase [Methylobacterium phyllostachyos]|uniref:Catechol 2,3-dioxygenase n=1 Tax=Methylobacterium phyllostachyos TaxID=582672 RepID=A0A1G9RIW9_9HYPH|nr:VOC family protein [Methylobacterium phyllostachyos]SDM23153.1 Catechol 2,3-dioxygenase [Methylobacterium phyllostachyos]
MSGVRAIIGFGRTVADLAATEAFYRDGLGFARVAPPEPIPSAQAEAMGLAERRATQLRMRLGAQTVIFLAVDPPGAPYPADPAATDPFFQHLAIPVRDMGSAMGHLAQVGPTPISRDGAQHLPAASGGVTAYKFRDPDGHPLELIFFPDGPPAARWRDAPGLFLGIDHSAITVTDLDAALAFLTGPLGLTVAQRGLNQGPEQARLDGLDAPQVDVIALEPPEPAPHVELLHYRAPAARRHLSFGPADQASTRYVFSTADPEGLLRRLRDAGLSPRASADGTALSCAGPDSHGFLFVRA